MTIKEKQILAPAPFTCLKSMRPFVLSVIWIISALMIAPQIAPTKAHAAGQKWTVVTTPNFRIMHLGAPQAPQVAALAEQARINSYLWLAGELPEQGWSPRCDIYLYPDRRDLHRMTGRNRDNIGSALSRPSRLSRGQILSRRINLTADDRSLLNSTLPHEVTHVVLKELFRGSQVPLWANEGLAVMSEGAPRHNRYTVHVWRKARSGGTFDLGHLMGARNYPEAPFKHLFYGQSTSLVRFFLNMGTPQQFIRFLQLSPEYGLEAQLQASYGISGLAELQQQWVIFTEVLGKWISQQG